MIFTLIRVSLTVDVEKPLLSKFTPYLRGQVVQEMDRLKCVGMWGSL